MAVVLICGTLKDFMKKYNTIVWACGALAVILTCCVYFGLFTSENTSMQINIGTYGGHIYRCTFDTKTLQFELLDAVVAQNASYVIQEGAHVYAVSETGVNSGVYSFNDSDTLVMTAEKRQTGADPCFIMTTDTTVMAACGKVLTADYSGGSVSVFPISNGVVGDCVQRLQFSGCGPVEGRQESPHIHQLKQGPGSEYVLATDLGADVIRLLRFKDGALIHDFDVQCPSGSGPRHMEFNQAVDRLYCICELSGEVLVYDIPTFDLLQRIQADEVNAGGSADIHMHPSGRFLYTSHRLDNDGISVFAVGEDGLLEKIAYTRTGRHPRNFMITPDGSLILVAAMRDNIIQVFRIAEDGTLTLTDSVLRFDSDQPSCITLAR